MVMQGKLIIRIFELIKERGISQRETAKIFGVSQGTFNNWENSNTQPSIEQLVSIARFFEVSVDYLIGNADDVGVINLISTLTPEQREVISLFSALPESARNATLTVLRQMYQGTN